MCNNSRGNNIYKGNHTENMYMYTKAMHMHGDWLITWYLKSMTNSVTFNMIDLHLFLTRQARAGWPRRVSSCKYAFFLWFTLYLDSVLFMLCELSHAFQASKSVLYRGRLPRLYELEYFLKFISVLVYYRNHIENWIFGKQRPTPVSSNVLLQGCVTLECYLISADLSRESVFRFHTNCRF